VIQAPSAAEPLLAPARTRAVARASEIAAAARASRRELTIAAVIVVWIGAGAVLESHATIWPQRALGVITWGVLLLILLGERRDVRAQVAIVILVATAMEYTASGLVGLYTYRLHNVPLFVPPGHGLLYLTALALGRSQLFAVLRRPVIGATIAVGGAWAIWGLAFSPRSDQFGAIFFLCLVGFLLAGRAPLVYAGAFLVCSYLELMGTSVGTWAWATHDPTGLVSIGNPPSGIPGAYCFFDAAALAGAAWLLGVTDSVGARVRRRASRPRLACRNAATDTRPVHKPRNAGSRHREGVERPRRGTRTAIRSAAHRIRRRSTRADAPAAPARAARS
jgi:hypothetical protein